MTIDDIRAASPVLGHYTESLLMSGMWQRPQLSARDRSIITVSALIARNQGIEMKHHMSLALSNGVKPAEVSEIIAHLAFYAGWANALMAASIAKEIFAERGIPVDQLPPVQGPRIDVDNAFEAMRTAAVDQMIGPAFQALAEYTTTALFHDLWLRPSLAPRDRSLCTVAALISVGQSAQIPFHVNKAMDNGMSQVEAAEAITHLAFYAGWPNAMSAAAIVKDIFAKRSA
ncbi:carboxymuconolactone decarboxylase family protein [Paraburkholderia sp. NPDC080076]|uniref:carboxymuconolactone decarboxylase family protein n=1 Tax=Paraburkholderia sp. NPDC080076 TaxID=3390605 RepID=UPI003D0847BD